MLNQQPTETTSLIPRIRRNSSYMKYVKQFLISNISSFSYGGEVMDLITIICLSLRVDIRKIIILRGYVGIAFPFIDNALKLPGRKKPNLLSNKTYQYIIDRWNLFSIIGISGFMWEFLLFSNDKYCQLIANKSNLINTCEKNATPIVCCITYNEKNQPEVEIGYFLFLAEGLFAFTAAALAKDVIRYRMGKLLKPIALGGMVAIISHETLGLMSSRIPDYGTALPYITSLINGIIFTSIPALLTRNQFQCNLSPLDQNLPLGEISRNTRWDALLIGVAGAALCHGATHDSEEIIDLFFNTSITDSLPGLLVRIFMLLTGSFYFAYQSMGVTYELNREPLTRTKFEIWRFLLAIPLSIGIITTIAECDETHKIILSFFYVLTMLMPLLNFPEWQSALNPETPDENEENSFESTSHHAPSLFFEESDTMNENPLKTIFQHAPSFFQDKKNQSHATSEKLLPEYYLQISINSNQKSHPSPK